ncbi:hypothetical protein A4D02_09110 [Niastella koreensis]|uniref:Methyltransferase type 12 n=2 Tax=Niastella koreensis TaxID=354356 RepID=G8TKL8_NIAKG|nr:hypothetical protein [Niastella koreensis]AEV98692.1 hypothetical protein Niako_2348 [Niastella koreensis GR20-10]OQP44935.1 hypothetical protein A4D02_09110 [Niastella koreensis]
MTTSTDISPSLQEFKNLMQTITISINDLESKLGSYGAFRRNNSSLLTELNEQDYLYRMDLISEYYNIDRKELEPLIELQGAERTAACKEKGVNGFFIRTLFDYNRYMQCYMLHNFLLRRFQFKGKHLLDFGCLIADYGFYFGMLQMKITLCDLRDHVAFASYRLSRANIDHVNMYAPANYSAITKGQDIAVFGEVLEHLTDPYLLLESCVNNNVQYIFTTMYPYGDDYYFGVPGHTQEAKEQAPACMELLRKHYQEFNLFKKTTVWMKKGAY